MLPPESKQAEWVRDRLTALEAALPGESNAKPDHPWVRRLGPLAPNPIVLAKRKGLLLAIFKLKFLLSFFSSIWIYVLLFGRRFGASFAGRVLVHEMRHFVA